MFESTSSFSSYSAMNERVMKATGKNTLSQLAGSFEKTLLKTANVEVVLIVCYGFGSERPDHDEAGKYKLTLNFPEGPKVYYCDFPYDVDDKIKAYYERMDQMKAEATAKA